jgi:hypothetical protein
VTAIGDIYRLVAEIMEIYKFDPADVRIAVTPVHC